MLISMSGQKYLYLPLKWNSTPKQEGFIWETRKCHPRPPPIQRGIEYFVYANVLKNHNFWAFEFGHFRRPNLAKANQHIMTFHPLKMYSPFKLIFKKKLLFFKFWPNSADFRWSNLAETVIRHIYTSKPFIWAYSQVTMTFHSKVIKSKWWQMNGHPNSLGSKL